MLFCRAIQLQIPRQTLREKDEHSLLFNIALDISRHPYKILPSLPFLLRNGILPLTMILINAHKLEKSFSSKTLFHSISFGLDEGERIGLLGPNGAGKSTLLKILAGMADLDSGQISKKKGLRLGYLEQTPTFQQSESVLSAMISKCNDPDDSYARAYEMMGVMDFYRFGDSFPAHKLSGGWQKRLALARELMSEPELLLLDEPTNHLDVASILWLEDYLCNLPTALLIVTHDRLFLQRVVTRIMDLDPRNPNELLNVPGDYLKYLEIKEQELHAQARHEKVLRNTLRRETEWLRRGAKARQTKQKARMEAAHELAANVSDLAAKNRHQKVGLDFGELDKTPKKLIEATGIAKSYNGETLFTELDMLVTPKTRLAILGHNGCGKSTLIRTILGYEKPDAGRVKVGATESSVASDVKISYFEQNRETLNPTQSVFKNICPQGDFVTYRGQHIHARSYLDRFLFSGTKVDLPVAKLSGGEQARLRLAQLMLKDAQVLVLDEPTNDLDSDTLEVLENALTEFNGAVIIVTHDRYFMDAVSRQILAFPPEGCSDRKLQLFSSYLQWEEWYENFKSQPKKSGVEKQKAKTPEPQTANSMRLSSKEKSELDKIESFIQNLESELQTLTTQSLNSDLVKDHQKMAKLHTEMAKLQETIDAKYKRWEELENRLKKPG